MGLYTRGGARGWTGRQREMTTCTHWSCARSGVCTLRLRYEHLEKGVDGWGRARTRHNGHRLFAQTWLRELVPID
jgi:hypothetical protein